MSCATRSFSSSGLMRSASRFGSTAMRIASSVAMMSRMRSSFLNLRSLSSLERPGQFEAAEIRRQRSCAAASRLALDHGERNLAVVGAVAVAITRLSTENGVPLSPMMVISRSARSLLRGLRAGCCRSAP